MTKKTAKDTHNLGKAALHPGSKGKQSAKKAPTRNTRSAKLALTSNKPTGSNINMNVYEAVFADSSRIATRNQAKSRRSSPALFPASPSTAITRINALPNGLRKKNTTGAFHKGFGLSSGSGRNSLRNNVASVPLPLLYGSMISPSN